jgi:hypothetical protein
MRPSIALRSPIFGFHRPSFAYSIGLRSPFDRLRSGCVRSPRTPIALEAPSRAHSYPVFRRATLSLCLVESPHRETAAPAPPDRQTQRGTDHAKSFKVDSFEKGCIALVIGMRVLRAPIGGISTQQQHRGFHANALVEYQAHNRSWTIARSAARVTQPVFLLARDRVALNPSSHRRPSYGLARRIGSNVGSNRRINTDRSVQIQSLESSVSPICTFGASLRRDLRARSLMTFSTLGGKEARARPGDR